MSRTSEPAAVNFVVQSSLDVPTSYTRISPPNVPATRMVRQPVPWKVNWIEFAGDSVVNVASVEPVTALNTVMFLFIADAANIEPSREMSTAVTVSPSSQSVRVAPRHTNSCSIERKELKELRFVELRRRVSVLGRVSTIRAGEVKEGEGGRGGGALKGDCACSLAGLAPAVGLTAVGL
eukprot:scaffold115120_cov31-Tisochrysis_lutea.AAC.1